MARFLEIDIDFRALSSLAKGLTEYGRMLTKELQQALTDTVPITQTNFHFTVQFGIAKLPNELA